MNRVRRANGSTDSTQSGGLLLLGADTEGSICKALDHVATRKASSIVLRQSLACTVARRARQGFT